MYTHIQRYADYPVFTKFKVKFNKFVMKPISVYGAKTMALFHNKATVSIVKCIQGCDYACKKDQTPLIDAKL